jgi:hypothetical protein
MPKGKTRLSSLFGEDGSRFEPYGRRPRPNRKIAAKKPSSMEQNAAVASRLHAENKGGWHCHEATKLTPRCLDDVDHDDNGELP